MLEENIVTDHTLQGAQKFPPQHRYLNVRSVRNADIGGWKKYTVPACAKTHGGL